MFTTASLCLLFLLYQSTGDSTKTKTSTRTRTSTKTGTGDITGTGSHNVEV